MKRLGWLSVCLNNPRLRKTGATKSQSICRRGFLRPIDSRARGLICTRLSIFCCGFATCLGELRRWNCCWDLVLEVYFGFPP
uniref:Uncharacterized protein n=1 Tax=Brassica oleracea TaxID=3712 RepID=A0A3P6BVM1_BRAOL|nr:unnamed protein product [Brassica oleracea]